MRIQFWHKFASVIVGGAIAMSWMHHVNTSYGVGKTIRDFNIDCCSEGSFKSFVWETNARERFDHFLNRMKIAPEDFRGTIVIARELGGLNEFTIYIKDGKYDGRSPDTPDKELDKELQEDLDAIRNSGLAAMLKSTKNDWRIDSHNNGYPIPPVPFSGQIRVFP